ncbi:ankyrin repeat-containing domain protein [Cercophora newfieldiana]|uniref:Ankyrin repeat-containing domain protein n=1 Tax=Cercophora newfieldiana TaxID=92897 RepID=A0AA39Y1L7_9PEZI|nr:ankyrin repeat-containing domain protein [Cercophora newfieldiana]
MATTSNSVIPDPAFDPTLETDDLDEYCWTPLQLAARAGDLPEVNKILLSAVTKDDKRVLANAPPTGYYGQTALQAACMRSHADVVRALLDAGADIHAPGGNNSYRNAFDIACGIGNRQIVDMMLAAGALVNPARGSPVTRYGGRTPLQAAAEGGHTALVLQLLGLGADVNAPASTSSGVTALQGAVWGQHHDVVSVLLAHGADVNARPARYKGVTALQAAALVGDMRMVELLLGAGAHVQAAGSQLNGGTALHAAAAGGHIDVVQRLLDAGHDPNAEAGWAHQTPVQCAFLIGRTDIVDLLVRAGARGPMMGGKILFTTVKRQAGVPLMMEPGKQVVSLSEW